MKIDEVSDIARKLKPIIGNRAERLWQFFLYANSPDEILETQSLIRLIAAKEKALDFERSIILPPPSRPHLNGTISVGDVLYQEKTYGQFALNQSDFARHLLIVGMTGAGKTNLSLNFLWQLAESNIPFLILDWKQNYRKLRGLPGLMKLRVIKPEDVNSSFKFNPLIPPPGIAPKHWMGLMIDVIKHSFFVMFGPEYFFRRGIHALYSQKGVYEGSRNYPTFEELEKLLKSEFVRGRELLWMSSVKRVLNALGKMGMLSHVVNVSWSDDILKIMENPTIIELDGLPVLERIFLTEIMLLWIYHYRKNQGATKELRHVILLEEAHHILSQKKETLHGEESIMELTMRMAREFGQGLIVVDQEPSRLSRSALANTGCKISMTLGNGWDIKAMSEAMCLTSSERMHLGKLPIGSAIVTISSRFPEPILVKCPLFDLEAIMGERRPKAR